jgi:molybdopterin-guanine dinucleotide biosynthesis protein A
VYQKSCLTVIEGNLKEGQRKLHHLFEQLQTKKIPEPILRQADPKLLSFENINRLPDLEALTALLQP